MLRLVFGRGELCHPPEFRPHCALAIPSEARASPKVNASRMQRLCDQVALDRRKCATLPSILSPGERRTQVAGVLGIRRETVREAPGEGFDVSSLIVCVMRED